MEMIYFGCVGVLVLVGWLEKYLDFIILNGYYFIVGKKLELRLGLESFTINTVRSLLNG